jgi:hypothetical protein
MHPHYNLIEKNYLYLLVKYKSAIRSLADAKIYIKFRASVQYFTVHFLTQNAKKPHICQYDFMRGLHIFIR